MSDVVMAIACHKHDECCAIFFIASFWIAMLHIKGCSLPDVCHIQELYLTPVFCKDDDSNLNVSTMEYAYKQLCTEGIMQLFC